MQDAADWYRDAIFYELHVRAYADSNGDGVGDFAGLIERLDHLRRLGVNVLWLLPFYASPGKDDGYDIADYYTVNPQYGTLADFRRLVREAHARQIRVVTELIANHTSDQHAWFQRARRARAGSVHRDYYVWSDSDRRYQLARVIFKDFEPSNWSWDHEAGAYYWHRFYSHQPDLNFESPAVRRELLRVVDFWLSLGVDGFRLDAIPYLFEEEGTDCENLPRTHDFLRELRQHIDRKFPGRILLAEANQWPEMAASYFGAGDECHMAFHFPLMPRLFMAIRMEDRFPIIDILAQTPAPPTGGQWALFLRNHDELTLEMVTDEERDFMYSAYSEDPVARINLGIRRRLAPLLDNNRRRIELMNGLLFALPGTPVIYYGDEIGMGDNIYLGDRNGVRTPMQWTPDRNAGFSSANPQRLYLPVTNGGEYHYETVNVESQTANPSSLLSWTRRLIRLRKSHPAFGRGSLELLQPHNRTVLAFVREHESERILVVANLSRFAQQAQLDLSRWRDLVPYELFGESPFSAIGSEPYQMTLGPHEFFWFDLRSQPLAVAPESELLPAPLLRLPSGDVADLFWGPEQARLEAVLPAYLERQRWYGGKAKRRRSLQIRDVIDVDHARLHVLLLDVLYFDGSTSTYLLPVSVDASGGDPQSPAGPTVVEVETGDGAGHWLIRDAAADPELAWRLLAAFGDRRRFNGRLGRLGAQATPGFARMRGGIDALLEPVPADREQSNTSIRYGERLVLKLIRRLEPGINPELEMGRALSEQTNYSHAAGLAGSLQYQDPSGAELTTGILQAFVPNHGDAWNQMQAELDGYLAAAMFSGDSARGELGADAGGPGQASIDGARLLGRRVAEMHLALLGLTGPGLIPEPVTPQQLRSMHQSVRSGAVQALDLLRDRVDQLDEPDREAARSLLDASERVLEVSRGLLQLDLDWVLIRCHGDLHLGQILFTGIDYVVTDFEGEPASSIKERRRKRAALRDVAGMLRSFDYAASFALLGRSEVPTQLVAAAGLWSQSMGAEFLATYLETCGNSPVIPSNAEQRQLLLRVLIFEKACYELRYELNNRPRWVSIPLQAMRRMLALASP